MKKNQFLVILGVNIIISLLFVYIFVDNSNKFRSDFLKAEKNLRDSLSKKIIILAEQSDSIQADIKKMTDSLSADRIRFSTQLNKIRYEKPTIINYTYYSDTALISRLQR
jgi:hypothetical protein